MIRLVFSKLFQEKESVYSELPMCNQWNQEALLACCRAGRVARGEAPACKYQQGSPNIVLLAPRRAWLVEANPIDKRELSVALAGCAVTSGLTI